MNEKFEKEIKTLLEKMKKLQIVVIVFTVIGLICNIGLILLDSFQLSILGGFAIMVLLIVVNHGMKKFYNNLLNTYQTDRGAVLKRLEIYDSPQYAKSRNKTVISLRNSYYALKEQK